MIRTLILSFNSSVWLHLTLYIAWEQPNIPQHSSILACWDTLHLPAAIQGPKGSTKAKKKSNSPLFSLLHLWVTTFNIPGGCRKWGRSCQAGSFHSQMVSPPAQIPAGTFGVGIYWRRKDLLCFPEGARWCWVVFWVFPGFASPLHLLFLPLVPRSSHPQRQLLEWGLTHKAGLVGFRTGSGWDLGTAQEKLLACFTSLPHPREAASAHSSIRRKLGASFLSLNFKPGHL